MQNQCPQCTHTGPENFFGTLGSVKTIHFRCRMCGWMWWCVQEEQEPEDEEDAFQEQYEDAEVLLEPNDDAEDELWERYATYITSIIAEQDEEAEASKIVQDLLSELNDEAEND